MRSASKRFDSTDRRSVAYLLYSALETRYYTSLSGEARRAIFNIIGYIIVYASHVDPAAERSRRCYPVADHLRCPSVHLGVLPRFAVRSRQPMVDRIVC